jgi:hypothetical protein
MRIICNDAKPRVDSVLLHDSSQGHLRCARHRIRLIQDDQLVARHGGGWRSSIEDLFRRGKGLDLLTYNVDSTVIGSIELKHHLSNILGAVDATGEGKNRRGFSGARRAIKKKMREAL